MSTFTGQSFEQPLHDRHRSRASSTSLDRHPSVMTSPSSISNSSRVRPRVVCISSRVTMNDGHMTSTPSGLRHFPTPTQRIVACAKSCRSSPYVNLVSGRHGL